MFNLDEALRNHLAQRQKEPKRNLSPLVSPLCRQAQIQAGRGLSPMSPPLRKTITSTTAIIQWLKEEGAHLYVINNALCFRPTDWVQLAIVSANWRALSHELTAVDQEQRNGSGR